MRAGGCAAFAPEVVLDTVAGGGVAFLFAAHVLLIAVDVGGEGDEEQGEGAWEDHGW